ncbi:MAG: xanthine dehydrogenase family protein molybdopterin-binding subunit, partial [Acidimicrobiales bacterium]
REQMMDHVARHLNLDPLDFRRRNIVTDAELPYTSATGMKYENMALEGCLDQAAEMVDYAGFRDRQAAALVGGRYLGIGISTYVEPSAIAWGSLAAERALLRIDPGGKVVLLMGSGEHGQSVGLTMSQLVAEHLGCLVEDVEFIQGDTAATPFGGGTAGSRTSVIAGGAAIGAAKTLRGNVVDIAAHLLEAAPADIEVLEGRAFVAGSPASGLSFAELAQVTYRQTDQLAGGPAPELETTYRYQPPNMFTFSNACHMCVCEVDVETGLVDLQRYIVSEDCGPMINPTVVEGQISGGVVQGIGGVLYEHMAYDSDGNPLASTFLDYLLPGAAEMPIIEIGHIETPADTEGGFKGMSEGGTIGAPAAVANAVADALAPLGVEPTRFPLGPSQLVDLIAAAEMKPHEPVQNDE